MRGLKLNLLIPVLIILVSGLVGVNLWVTRKIENPGNVQVTGLRQLTLKAPGMFCLGCEASVENYIKAMPGVESADASLTSKLVGVIYDPAKVSKEEILANTIFDAYGREFISDESFSGEVTAGEEKQLPASLAQKLQQISSLTYNDQGLLNKYISVIGAIDKAIESGDFAQAERLANQLLEELLDNSI